ncbi:MAG: HAMP domain-containing protein [Elusimicrobia bacterium]|nr:HAMP domain-containing protein [Elusimicrobiota bacterium]
MTTNRRRRILIEPRFQIQMMLHLAGWSALATLITAGCLVLFLLVADQRSPGDFFFVRPEAGSHPTIFKRTDIVLPAVAVSLIVNLALGLTFALFYSQRLAGPLHRLSQDMLRIARGEPVKPVFHMRGTDELQAVAHAFEALLRALAEKGLIKGP